MAATPVPVVSQTVSENGSLPDAACECGSVCSRGDAEYALDELLLAGDIAFANQRI